MKKLQWKTEQSHWEIAKANQAKWPGQAEKKWCNKVTESKNGTQFPFTHTHTHTQRMKKEIMKRNQEWKNWSSSMYQSVVGDNQFF